jgi:hypothetical protein
MKKILNYISIGLILLLGLKSCIVTTISIEDYVLGSRVDEGNQFSRALITPKNELLIAKQFEDISEIGLYKIKGILATKYFLGFYHLKSKGIFPFGLRYYPQAKNVLDSELTLVYKEGNSFPEIGQTFKAKIIVYKDHFVINKDDWEIIPMDSNNKLEAEALMEKLREM